MSIAATKTSASSKAVSNGVLVNNADAVSSVVQCSSEVRLESVMEEVEHQNHRVKIMRGQKVVAEIVPTQTVANHQSDSAQEYKTWGESLA